MVARELAEFGKRPRVEPGIVSVSVAQPAEAAALAHQLRTPSRLLLVLARGQTATLDQLSRLVHGIDWAPFLSRHADIRVSVVSRGSKIRRKDTAEKKVLHALNDVKRRLPVRGRPSRDAVQQHVRIKLDGAKGMVSIDVGGDLLHKRGWRRDSTKAPLRESLAASLLVLAGWTGDEPLLDPFCGAGTFCIEAGLLATRRSPFVGRTLACFDWPSVQGPPREQPLPLEVPLFAFDHAEQAIAATRENARRAKVRVETRQVDVAHLDAPAPSGLLIANPPYGARLGRSESSVAGVYRALGRTLRGPLSGWRALFLAPNESLARTVDRHAFCLTTFSNGSRSVGAWALDAMGEE